MPSHRARVVVTGDEPLVADGLALVLRRARIDSLYADTTARARRFADQVAAGAVVWAGEDLDRKTLDAFRELRGARPAIGLCLLSQRADAYALERLVAQRGEGLAFLLRTPDLDAHDFVRLVSAVLRGHSTVDPALLQRLASSPRGGELLCLSKGDHEVMELVAAGLRNAEIARRLWKSEKAIEKHVGRLFSKLGLSPERTAHLDRRVAATRIYLASQESRRHGLVEHSQFEVLSPGRS